MKKRGLVIGLLFVVLMAFVFQTEIAGFIGDVRDRATDAGEADEAVIAAMPALDESEGGTPPPLPEGEGETEITEEEVSGAVTYQEVSLFFVDEGGDVISAEKRSIVDSGGVARATMTALIDGPADSSLSSYIPEGTEIRDISIDDQGLCTVDFSSEIQAAELDSREERYVIESIAKTLAQFPSVNSVQIKVNGAVCQSLTGHWDISAPIAVDSL